MIIAYELLDLMQVVVYFVLIFMGLFEVYCNHVETGRAFTRSRDVAGGRVAWGRAWVRTSTTWGTANGPTWCQGGGCFISFFLALSFFLLFLAPSHSAFSTRFLFLTNPPDQTESTLVQTSAALVASEDRMATMERNVRDYRVLIQALKQGGLHRAQN